MVSPYNDLKTTNKLVNITQRNILTDTENKLLVTSGEKERDKTMWVGH